MRESTIDDISEWYGLKQSLSRDGFVQRFTYPFLVQKPKAPGEKTGDDFGERIGYSTNIVDVNAIVSSHVPARLSGTRVIAVVKAPGNPFPDRISLGRAQNCDVVLRDPSVSKLHAYFTSVGAKKAEVTDMGSANGTRVNGEKIAVRSAVHVKTGDLLIFGGVAVSFLDAATLYDLL